MKDFEYLLRGSHKISVKKLNKRTGAGKQRTEIPVGAGVRGKTWEVARRMLVAA